MHTPLPLLLFLLFTTLTSARNLAPARNHLLARKDSSESSTATTTTTTAAHGSISPATADVVTLTGTATRSQTDLPDGSDDATVVTTVVDGTTARFTLLPSSAVASDASILTGTEENGSSTSATSTGAGAGAGAGAGPSNGTALQTTSARRQEPSDVGGSAAAAATTTTTLVTSAEATRASASASSTGGGAAVDVVGGWMGVLGLGVGVVVGVF